MKHALLILADGEVLTLKTRFVILTPCIGSRTLSVVDCFGENGLATGDEVVCDTLEEALQSIREIESKR